jgi:multidrug efflux system outer membrane protein
MYWMRYFFCPLVFLFSGCLSIQHPPEVILSTPPQWKEKTSSSEALPSTDNWWLTFHDPQLNKLVSLLIANQPQLKAASLRIDQARQNLRSSKADFFPKINSKASAVHETLSQSAFAANLPPGIPLPSIERERYSLGLDFSWELDLWGKIRHRSQSSLQRSLSAYEQWASLQLSLIAELAKNHFTARSLAKQSTILHHAILGRQTAENLQADRLKAGLSSELDLARAKTETALAINEKIQIDRQWHLTHHSIAILCGITPSQLHFPKSTHLPHPPTIPVTSPSSLLQRRPDIRSAYHNLAASFHDSKVAKANLLPNFQITGLGGLESIGIDLLLDWKSRTSSIGPSLTLPLFQGGKLRSLLKLSQLSHQEQLQLYTQTWLTAAREVEDALSNLRHYRLQNSATSKIHLAALTTSKLGQSRYEQGLTSYFEWVDSERTLLNAELSLAQIQLLQLLGSIDLYKALGGSFSNPIPKT